MSTIQHSIKGAKLNAALMALLPRVKAGDRAAANAFAEKIAGFLYKYAVKLTIVAGKRNKDAAQEAAQNAALKAVSRIDTFDPQKASITTWVAQIAENALRDAQRTQSLKSREYRNDKASLQYWRAKGYDDEEALKARDDFRARAQANSRGRENKKDIKGQRDEARSRRAGAQKLSQRLQSLREAYDAGDSSVGAEIDRLQKTIKQEKELLSDFREKEGYSDAQVRQRKAIIASMPENLRRVVVARGDPEDTLDPTLPMRSYKEVAEALSISVGLVMVSLHRARKLLGNLAGTPGIEGRRPAKQARTNPGRPTYQTIYVETFADAHDLCEAGIISKSEFRAFERVLR
jgi:RNA polymerase sigma factor (sigma-70 family)